MEQAVSRTFSIQQIEVFNVDVPDDVAEDDIMEYAIQEVVEGRAISKSCEFDYLEEI